MVSNEQKVILITGANGGIGYELASQLLADANNFILLGARSVEKGQAAVESLKKLPGTVELVQIDVNDEKSIAKAAEEVGKKYGRVDALVNNAAIALETPPITDSLHTRLTAAFLTNSTGPAVVVDFFRPLLNKAKHNPPRIVNVSSGAGSIGLRLDPNNPAKELLTVPYHVSKAALNMVTACQAYELGLKGWKVFAYCPGHTVSNLGPLCTEENGAQPTEKAARPIVEILEGKKDSEHGCFLRSQGGHWPW